MPAKRRHFYNLITVVNAMKIKMKSLMCGPSGTRNIGEIVEVAEAEGLALVDGGYAEEVEPTEQELEAEALAYQDQLDAEAKAEAEKAEAEKAEPDNETAELVLESETAAKPVAAKPRKSKSANNAAE
ncbi:hypothetical protein C0068_08230 [Zhongshania marina]|uniref:Uncharacterized protein n=2 Tax=Zhongshania marina TaxID=2304603 RepID=A0A2S4HGK1_9GAMM|nr:hypothetical protein C0068_08230 [Marortus luteolus]